MRPRVFPAEDVRDAPHQAASAFCFNEAAGIPRGRLAAVARLERERSASMRPRVFPAEDHGEPQPDERVVSASMRPRVFPAEDTLRCRVCPRFSCGFNEAAGIPAEDLNPWSDAAMVAALQ